MAEHQALNDLLVERNKHVEELYCAQITNTDTYTKGEDIQEYKVTLSIWFSFDTRDKNKTYLLYEGAHVSIEVYGKGRIHSSLNRLGDIIKRTEVPNNLFRIYTEEEIIAKLLEDNYLPDIKELIEQEIQNNNNN